MPEPEVVDSLTARRTHLAIALLALAAIAVHLLFRYGAGLGEMTYQLPLWVALGLGGTFLVVELLRKLLALEFGSDLLAGVSIVSGIVHFVHKVHFVHNVHPATMDGWTKWTEWTRWTEMGY